MVIKVNSIEEEYEYLRRNPHKCAEGKTGEWSKLGKKPLSMIGTDVLLIKCKVCGFETEIEFDPIASMPEELQNFFRHMRKR